jgi:hypothetical protein
MLFSHVVRWNDVEARIEMHLEAARDVHFSVDGRLFSMASGETIHTENSLKIRRAGRSRAPVSWRLDSDRRLDQSEGILLTDSCEGRDRSVGAEPRQQTSDLQSDGTP